MTGTGATAIIVAAGSGQRFERPDKAFVPFGDRPMIAWSIDTMIAAASITEIVLVVGDHTAQKAQRFVDCGQSAKPVIVARGGATRQDSVANGLAAVSPETGLVVIHDAARPLATPELVEDVLASARIHGAAIAAVPVTDTIKQASAEFVEKTLDRNQLWSVQTPQAFSYSLLLSAFREARAKGRRATDEAALVEATGAPVRIVPGLHENIKVTFPIDLAIAEALLRRRCIETSRA